MKVKFKDGRVKDATFKQWYESFCIDSFVFGILFSLLIFCSYLMAVFVLTIPIIKEKLDSSMDSTTYLILLGLGLIFYIFILISASKGFKILMCEFSKPLETRFMNNPYLEKRFRS